MTSSIPEAPPAEGAALQPWSFGRDLAAWQTRPARPRAAVLLLHGYAEHVGRYTHVIAALRERGFAVYAYDQRGHGRSPGPRALVRLADLVDDHLAAREALRRDEPLPLFTLSHSMGGLVSVTSTLRDPRGLTGVALSSPALISGLDQPPVLRRLAPYVARIAPGWAVGVNARGVLSREASVQDLFDRDPLCYTGKVKALTGAEIIRGGDAVWANLSRWTLPTLVIHGDDDRLITVEGSRRFAREIASPDRELWEVPGGYHELFNDVGKDEAIRKVTDWLGARVPAPRA